MKPQPMKPQPATSSVPASTEASEGVDEPLTPTHLAQTDSLARLDREVFSRDVLGRDTLRHPDRPRKKNRTHRFQALDLYPVERWLERWLEPERHSSSVRVSRSGERDCREAHLDTDDWRIHRAGLSLVMRRFESDEIWAILEARDAAKPFRRFQRRLESKTFDDGIREILSQSGELGDRCRALAGRRPLVVLFKAEVRVQQYRLVEATQRAVPAPAQEEPEGDSPLGLRDAVAGSPWEAEILLEETRIPLDGRDHPIVLSQVEVIEPRSARPEFWREFIAGCGLQKEARGRLGRLLVAAGIAPPPPSALGPTTIDEAATVGDAAFAVLRIFMGRVLDHEPGTRLGDDIEELHQMRVGTRKLRSAIKLYRDFLPPRVTALEGELRWLGGVLGPVRDLDVQQVVLRELAEEIPERERVALEFLWESLATDHTRERRKMLRALDSRRFERFKERWIGALLQGPPRSFRPGRQPALMIVPSLIEETHAGVLKRLGKLRPKSLPTAYHRLRVRLKGLRYSVEFHRMLYPKRAKEYAKQVVWWQDLLGDHQDADVGEGTLRSYVRERGKRFPPETSFAIGMLAERYRDRARRLRKAVWRGAPSLTGGVWKRLRKEMRRRSEWARASLGPTLLRSTPPAPTSVGSPESLRSPKSPATPVPTPPRSASEPTPSDRAVPGADNPESNRP